MEPKPKRSDESEAVHFLLIKVAIFIFIPLAGAVVAVYFTLAK